MSFRAWEFAGTEDYFESANFFNAGHKPPPWTTGEPDLCVHTHVFHRRVSALNDKKCRVDSLRTRCCGQECLLGERRGDQPGVGRRIPQRQQPDELFDERIQISSLRSDRAQLRNPLDPPSVLSVAAFAIIARFGFFARCGGIPSSSQPATSTEGARTPRRVRLRAASGRRRPSRSPRRATLPCGPTLGPMNGEEDPPALETQRYL